MVMVPMVASGLVRESTIDTGIHAYLSLRQQINSQRCIEQFVIIDIRAVYNSLLGIVDFSSCDFTISSKATIC